MTATVQEARLVALKDHPKAGPAIRRAKAVGGMAGFGLALAGGLMHGAPVGNACARAIVSGLGTYLVVWAAAVATWRHVLRAQARTVAAQVRERRAAAIAQAQTGRDGA